MDSDLEQAVKKAGFKLGGGLLFLSAILAIRVVTVTPAGVESEIEELEDVASEIAAEETAAGRDEDLAPTPPAKEDPSFVSRLGAKVVGKPVGSGHNSQDADRLVSCNLAAGTQFMRAADCATRGGTSTDFD
jgi:hypothetical protein